MWSFHWNGILYGGLYGKKPIFDFHFSPFVDREKSVKNFTFPPFPQMKEDTHSSQKPLVLWYDCNVLLTLHSSNSPSPFVLNSPEEAILIKARDVDRSVCVSDIKMMGKCKKFTRNACATYISMYIISWRKKRTFFLEENWLCDEIEETDLLYLHASHNLLSQPLISLCVYLCW